MAQDKTNPSQYLYSWLDKFLLFLLTAEFLYLLALLAGSFLGMVVLTAVEFNQDYINAFAIILLFPFMILTMIFMLNILGGFGGLVLNIYNKHEGYPGTGHLLNWIFLLIASWFFLFAIVVIIFTAFYYYGTSWEQWAGIIGNVPV